MGIAKQNILYSIWQGQEKEKCQQCGNFKPSDWRVTVSLTGIGNIGKEAEVGKKIVNLILEMYKKFYIFILK